MGVSSEGGNGGFPPFEGIEGFEGIFLIIILWCTQYTRSFC